MKRTCIQVYIHIEFALNEVKSYIHVGVRSQFRERSYLGVKVHKGKQVILQLQDVTAELKVCQVLNCNFASRVVIHTPRSCDLVAHELAIVGAGLSPGLISVRDCIPSCIQVLVC